MVTFDIVYFIGVLCTPHLYHCKETGHWEPTTCITTLTGTSASCPWGDSTHTMPAAKEPRDGLLQYRLFQGVFREGQFHTAGHWTAQI